MQDTALMHTSLCQASHTAWVAGPSQWPAWLPERQWEESTNQQSEAAWQAGLTFPPGPLQAQQPLQH